MAHIELFVQEVHFQSTESLTFLFLVLHDVVTLSSNAVLDRSIRYISGACVWTVATAIQSLVCCDCTGERRDVARTSALKCAL
jgi:hypothetical protein